MKEIKTPAGFISNIQILRLLAASMVLFGHVQHEITDLAIGGKAGFVPIEPVMWGWGVDIFFILSGFIMYYLCHDRFGIKGESGKFLLRRAIRLVPTYWFFTGLMLLAALIFKSQVVHAQIDVKHVLASFFFLPWPNPSGDTMPFLLLGWTLNYEVLFYVCFALVLILPKFYGLLALFLTFIFAALAHSFIPSGLWMLKFWTEPIIIEFLMGIALAHAFIRGYRLKFIYGLLISLAGAGLMVLFFSLGWTMSEFRFICGGIPALLICIGVALTPEPATHANWYRVAVLGGTASYSLYLSHPFTINVVGLVWKKLGLEMPWVFLAVTLFVSIVASIFIYLFFEKPVISYLNRNLAFGRSKLNAPKGMPARGG